MIWSEVVSYWAAWQPDAVAVRFGDEELSWAELDRRTAALAAGFSRLGVGRGDRVGMLLGNRPAFIETAVACMKLGAIAVPVNIRLTPPELAGVLGHADPAIVVTEATLAPGLARLRADRPELTVLDADDGSFSAALIDGAPPAVAVADDDPLFICYTSGTTAAPKGAVLTHRSWHYSAMCRALQGGINLDDRVLLPFPLAFTGGLALWMVALWAGATLVLEPAFEAGRALELIEGQRISVLMAVPLIWQQLADHPAFATTDLSSIRCGSSGGAPVPVPLLRIWHARGVPMTQTYSLTEVSASGITLPYREAFTRAGYCGVPARHSQARIVDEQGRDCPPGEVGEIVIKGPEVMAGYWRNPEATARTIRDGWCHTGDLGLRDADGYFKVVDRAKDMLISGGLNVYPAELEELLTGLPGVVELAVIGVPHPRWGETPAVVVYSAGRTVSAAEVLQACRGVVADYKLPRYLVVRDEPLPRNMAGKVLKRDLREAYADLFERIEPIR